MTWDSLCSQRVISPHLLYEVTVLRNLPIAACDWGKGPSCTPVKCRIRAPSKLPRPGHRRATEDIAGMRDVCTLRSDTHGHPGSAGGKLLRQILLMRLQFTRLPWNR